MTKTIILDFLKAHKQELNDKFGIEEMALFGSYAKDEEKEDSDIDLLVIEMRQKNAFTLINAKKILPQNLNKEVDLGLLDSMRPFMRSRIQKDMILWRGIA